MIGLNPARNQKERIDRSWRHTRLIVREGSIVWIWMVQIETLVTSYYSRAKDFPTLEHRNSQFRKFNEPRARRNGSSFERIMYINWNIFKQGFIVLQFQPLRSESSSLSEKDISFV